MSSLRSSSRKSFLIDSLLERQLALAAQSSKQSERSEHCEDLKEDKDDEDPDRLESFDGEDREEGDVNGNEQNKMPLLMNAHASTMPEPQQAQEEAEEDRGERNTSTPDSQTVSPNVDRLPNNAPHSSQLNSTTANLRALAASVASSPFFNLFSNLMSSGDPRDSDTPVSTSPAISANSNALAQSIEYYNRLRLIGLPLTPSSASHSLLSAAAMATLPGVPSSSTTLPTSAFPPTSSSTFHSTLQQLLQTQKLASRTTDNKRTNKSNTKTDPDFPESTRVGRRGGSARSSNVKKYRCDVCEKTFSRSNTLITHKRIHTGEKPFRCEHCNRAFRQPGNLTRHRLTHTTVKPFVCKFCDKAFNRASNLHTHMRTHYNASSASSSVMPTIWKVDNESVADI